MWLAAFAGLTVWFFLNLRHDTTPGARMREPARVLSRYRRLSEERMRFGADQWDEVPMGMWFAWRPGPIYSAAMLIAGCGTVAELGGEADEAVHWLAILLGGAALWFVTAWIAPAAYVIHRLKAARLAP